MNMKNKGRVMVILAGILLFLMAARQYTYLQNQGKQISIRGKGSLISAKDLDRYYEQARENANAEETDSSKIPNVTLWNEKKDVEVSAGEYFTGSGYTLKEGYGDLEKLLPGHLKKGGYPEKNDTSGCAISNKGAITLFGSDQVIGKEITVLGKTYIIRGMIEWEEDCLWIQNPDAEGFQNIELVYSNRSPQTSDASRWMMQVGAGDSQAVITGSTYQAFGRLFLSLPVWVLWAALVRRVHYELWRKRQGNLRTVLKILFAAAVIIGTVVGIRYSFSFGGDFIPSRWSDFAFFQEKWKMLKETAESIQNLPYYAGDAALLSHSRQSAWLAFGAAAAMAAGIFTGQKRESK